MRTQPMHYFRAFWLRAALVAFLTVPHTGCNLFILAGYLIGGPPSIEPDFDAQTRLSMSEKDKSVAVVCYAPNEVKWDFDAIDKELGKFVAHRLAKNSIVVRDPDIIQGWTDENPEWDRPDEIGAAMEVDYVIFIEVSSYSLYEENASNLFRGRSDAMVSVYEMEGNEGHVIYTKEIESRFPIHSPVSTGDMSYYNFKRLYLSRLSDEIGRLFYEHYAGDDIPHGGL